MKKITLLLALISATGFGNCHRHFYNNYSQEEMDAITVNFGNCPTETLVLSSQVEIDNFVTLYGNCDLTNLDLKISGSDITNLDGLQSLGAIGGKLTIIDNPLLNTLSGIGNLEFTGENAGLLIENNPSLTEFANFFGILSSEMGITIGNNPLLENLTGLEGILVAQNLTVLSNNSLNSLEGLEGLTDIDGDIVIDTNTTLTNITAIEGVDPFNIDFLGITNNSSLSVCDISNLCQFLENNGDIVIENNANGCNAESEVVAACDGLGVLDTELEKLIFIVPNPASEVIQINLRNGVQLENLQLYSMLGKKLKSTSEATINVSNLSVGIYFAKIKTNSGSITKRFIKE